MHADEGHLSPCQEGEGDASSGSDGRRGSGEQNSGDGPCWGQIQWVSEHQTLVEGTQVCCSQQVKQRWRVLESGE